MPPPARRLSPMAARAQVRREARLAEMAEQVDTGRLVVRQMTVEEREKLELRLRTRPRAVARKPLGRGR